MIELIRIIFKFFYGDTTVLITAAGGMGLPTSAKKWELKDKSAKEVPFTLASTETQAKPTTTTENPAPLLLLQTGAKPHRPNYKIPAAV